MTNFVICWSSITADMIRPLESIIASVTIRVQLISLTRCRQILLTFFFTFESNDTKTGGNKAYLDHESSDSNHGKASIVELLGLHFNHQTLALCLPSISTHDKKQ